jgi:hypothetical protein
LIYALTTVDKSSVGDRLTAIFNGSGNPDAESIRKMFSNAYKDKMTAVNASAPFDDKAREAHYSNLAEIIESLLREPGFKPDYSKVTGRKSLSCPDESSEFAAIRCFSEVIKLRYLLLFYLIACHMKNSTALCDYKSFRVVNICLAGYGSRGLGFCTGTEIGSNGGKADVESPYIELVQKLMAKVLGVENVAILLPSANEKEEVVWGLLEKSTIAATQDHEDAKKSSKAPGFAARLARQVGSPRNRGASALGLSKNPTPSARCPKRPRRLGLSGIRSPPGFRCPRLLHQAL